ncbi:hypothetical protein LEP1GSC083_5008 [Leptospira interrogans serovar Pyrogenes str. L0374]|uniref:Uncharacterized protein n=3 Tax=Leptospira interrogans TaxID=173 RepID=A0A829D6Y2_LEPIR|nr:hypothetical protein LEP1GSC083_5008 [Leptospira interrogans serovar Pyrogenes str. L0374]EMY06187.1 hypothetical protein LEP1GSC029_3025 [Leptospira interrogans str. 2002000626]EMY22951.1 hypothetical protein LEP1GSC115_0674 [Leptospira interrogans serovar Australis str. 200703203]
MNRYESFRQIRTNSMISILEKVKTKAIHTRKSIFKNQNFL